jgi:predicted AlkP superfamily phosphohydrolase/phosphomutase
LRYLLDEKEWDFFMFVEMGVDRIHHGLWAHHDPNHHKHDPSSPYVNSIKEYYHYLDQEIGTLLKKLPPETHIIVISDHGVKKMDGGLCINDWLRQEGYLVLLEDPPVSHLSSFEKVEVDWTKTTVWGDGGYYGRIFLNVAGREPNGVIKAEEYEDFRDKLANHIKSIPGPDGKPLDTKVYKPQDIYQEVRNVPPDLIVYFDNLGWRSVGTFGHGSVYTFENDTGPDDANHAVNGIYIHTPPERNLGGKKLQDTQLMDFAPTVLDIFGLPVPADMQGKRIEL